MQQCPFIFLAVTWKPFPAAHPPEPSPNTSFEGSPKRTSPGQSDSRRKISTYINLNNFKKVSILGCKSCKNCCNIQISEEVLLFFFTVDFFAGEEWRGKVE